MIVSGSARSPVRTGVLLPRAEPASHESEQNEDSRWQWWPQGSLAREMESHGDASPSDEPHRQEEWEHLQQDALDAFLVFLAVHASSVRRRLSAHQGSSASPSRTTNTRDDEPSDTDHDRRPHAAESTLHRADRSPVSGKAEPAVRAGAGWRQLAGETGHTGSATGARRGAHPGVAALDPANLG